MENINYNLVVFPIFVDFLHFSPKIVRLNLTLLAQISSVYLLDNLFEIGFTSYYISLAINMMLSALIAK